MKKVVFTARNRGFGPISKAVSIAKILIDYEKTFIGVGNTIMYAENANIFNKIINVDNYVEGDLVDEISKHEFCIIIMEQEIALICSKNKIKYFFFDSLFGYWLESINKPILNELQSFDEVLKLDLTNFSSHEKKILAHHFAKSSFIQSFFDIKKKYPDVKKFLPNSFLIQPIIDMKPTNHTNKIYDNLLINLGGVEGFNENAKEIYYQFIEKLAKRAIYDKRLDISNVSISSGFRIKHGILYKNKKKYIEHCFYSSSEFKDKLKCSKFSVSAPGLTTILESIYLNKPTLFSFEQHGSHDYNLESLNISPLKYNALSIKEILIRKSIKIDCKSKMYNFILRDENIFELIYNVFVERLVNLYEFNQKEVLNEINAECIELESIKNILRNE